MKKTIRLAALAASVACLASCTGIKEIGHSEATSYRMNQGVCFDGKYAVVAGQKGYFMTTADGGKSWHEGKTGAAGCLSIEFLDRNTVLLSGTGGYTARIPAGGTQVTRTGNISGGCPYLSFSSQSDGWAGNLINLFATADGARSWTAVPLPREVPIVAGICSAGPGAGYVFSGDGQLWFTGDGGANWEKRARVFDPGTQGFVADYARFRQIVSLRFRGERGVLACIGQTPKGSVLAVYRSEDAGRNWVPAGQLRTRAALASVYVSPDMERVSTFNSDSTVSLFKF